jgi:hypothetical protein
MLTLSVFWLACVTGCGIWPSREPPGEAELVAKATADHYGGVDRLGKISTISGTALVKVYDDDGAAHVYGQEIEIRPSSRRITAKGRRPGGTWRARVSLDGEGRVSCRGGLRLTGRESARIRQVLRFILHRVGGPMNLLEGRERAEHVDRVFVGAYPMRRVVTSGRPALASAYFFDETANELRMVTTGDYEIPGEGTVTIYTNARTGDGLMLPAGLDVVDLGANSFVGQKKIFSVRLEDLEVR